MKAVFFQRYSRITSHRDEASAGSNCGRNKMLVKHKGERKYIRRASVNQLRINDRPGDELFTSRRAGSAIEMAMAQAKHA